MYLTNTKILMSLKILVLGVSLLLSINHAQAVVSSMTANMPNGVVITTTVDTTVRTITYNWNFTTLPGDYGQVDIDLPGIPLRTWCATSCAVGAGITEIVIFDAAGGAAESRLQLVYEGGAAPPRENSVVLTYNSAYMFTGEFFDGAPVQADGDGNVLLSYRDPIGGEEGMLWAFTPVISPVEQTTNIAPVAIAGLDQSVDLGSTVMINGSDSYDLDNDPLTYSWTLLRPAGSSAVLSNAAVDNPSFVADAAGTYSVQLVVNDGTVDSAAASMTVVAVAPNTSPVANAGLDQSVFLNDSVTLDGSDSIDAEGDPLAFNWALTAPPTSGTTLSDVTAAAPSFTPDVAGAYSVVLTVNDGTADSAPDSVVITVAILPVNNAPVATAGINQTVLVGDTVSLDGSGSTDIDEDMLTYQWTLTAPFNSTDAMLSNDQAVSPTFLPDVVGTYTADLVVNDGTEDSAPDSVVITVAILPVNNAPIGDAGPNQPVLVNEPVFVNQPVTLDGGGSSDADGDALTYSWSLSIPPGSSAMLSNPAVVNPTFVPDQAGDYVAQLIVNDGVDDSVADTVLISVSSIPINSVPQANAGLDQSVFVGATVMLDGSGSIDADDDGLSYSWSFLTKPLGSQAVLFNATAFNPGFLADVSGFYVVQLIVSDVESFSLPVTVSITGSIEPVNLPPVADAGPDQIVVEGNLVRLVGAASSDPNDDTLTYFWSFNARPTGSLATLSGHTSDIPVFTADVEGTYLVQLIVSDQQFDSIPDTVTIQAEGFMAASNGELLYNTYCAGCHGDDAQGGIVGIDVYNKDTEKLQDSIPKLHKLSVQREFTLTEYEQISEYLHTVGSGHGR